jgi:glycolate oxidase FAD binding subunit
MRDLLLGVRFVQADGVTTWGGAKVVKSVTGYDVPKLMVGALGTLGVLTELTLRLHHAPEHEATWLASFPAAAQAQDCVAALLDSTLQPNRVEVLDGRALAASGLPVSPAALAISIATVEPAVRAQQTTLTEIVQRSRGAVQTMGASFWRTYDALGGALAVRLGTVPSRLAATMAVVATVLPELSVSGSAALGALRAMGPAPDGATLATALARLRNAVADVDGGVIVERAPRAVRAGLDPWGPTPALDLMRALKQEFDPRGILNPGRFVGGL